VHNRIGALRQAVERQRATGTVEAHASMATRDEIADAIASMAIFADLARPQLIGVASRFEEAFFGKDQKVLRQGLTGSGFYVIMDGEADVVADGRKLATLARGDFFGEVSVLLGEPPTADIVATRPMRCIVLGGPAVEGFLVDHPRVMYRMLQASARRLSDNNRRITASQ
jgi:CRP-like cAMP-binding protein